MTEPSERDREMAHAYFTEPDVRPCVERMAEYLAAAREEGRREERERCAWQPIEIKPDRPIMVEVFLGRYRLDGLPDYRDERRQLGFYDGSDFREMGTGHEFFESWRADDELPTHWRPLPPPPAEEPK